MDYYIPLTRLLPAIPAALLHRWPRAEGLLQKVGVRRVVEQWNDTHAVFTGELVVQGDFSFGPFAFGDAESDDFTGLPFELVTDRLSLLHHAIAAGEGTFAPDEIPPQDAKVKAILSADGPPLTFRLRIHFAQLRWRPNPEEFFRGKLVTDAEGRPIKVEELPDSPPLEIVLADLSLTFDSANNFLPSWDDLDLIVAPTVPPFVWRRDDRVLGFHCEEVSLDISETSGPAGLLARPGYTEAWRGLYVGALRLFGLDQIAGIFPPVIDLTGWVLDLDFKGWSGAADLAWPRQAGDTSRFRLERLGIEIDHGEFVRFTAEASLYLGGEPEVPEDDLILLFGLIIRDHPDGGWGIDVTVRTPRESDDALFSIPKPLIPLLIQGSALALAISENGGDSPGVIFVIGLLQLAVVAHFKGWLTLEGIDFTRFTTRYYAREVNGHRVRFLDFVFDLRAAVTIDLHLEALLAIAPHIKTPQGQPLRVEVRGLTVRWATNFNRFGADELPGVAHFGVDWDLEGGLSFSNAENLAIQEMVVWNLGLGRWERGLWIDVGLRLRGDRGNASLSAMAVRIFFEDSLWDIDHVEVEMKSLTFSLLIPETIYCHGALQWADGLTGSLRAFVVGNGTGAPDRYKKREAWVWEFGATLRELTTSDEAGEFRMLVITIELESTGGLPLLGTNASIFGFSAQYVQNARPALDAAHSDPPDYGWWFMDLEPRYRLDAPKWAPQRDANGFGAGLALGSTYDGGRVWKLKGGILVQKPGPLIIVHARGDLLGKPPKLKEAGGDAFAFLVVWDGGERQLTAELRYERKVPADGKTLELRLGGKLFADFDDARNGYLHLGEHWPLERRLAARFFRSLDLSFYAMVDGRGIQALAAHPDINLPGTAVALGFGARWEKGKKKGRLRCFFRLVVDVNVGFSFDGDLDVVAGVFVIDGGLVVKVYGLGFELHVYADLQWLNSQVEGEVGVRIGLPWPLPDIKAKVPIGMGDPADFPAPSAFVSGLTLHRPGDRSAVALAPDALATDVPIDAWLALAFAHPTRSAAQTTSFVLSDSNVTTSHVAGFETEYVFELVDLILWRGEAGTGTALPGPYAGLWKAEGTPAAGGKPPQRVLQLFTWDQIGARHVGPSADYLDGMTTGFDPCATAPTPKPVCYTFAAEPLGPIAPLRVLTAPTGQTLRVVVQPPPFTPDSVLRRGSLWAGEAEVVAAPIPLPEERLLRLPTLGVVSGPVAADPLLPHAADTLVLEHAPAAEALLSVIANPETSRVVVRFHRGAALVAEDAGTAVGVPVLGFQRYLYRCTLPATRAEIVADERKRMPQDGGQAHLVSACFLYAADLEQQLQQAATAAAWSSFWSDLLANGAATTDAQLLEPSTRYTLEALVRWWRRNPETLEETPPSPPQAVRFPFVTQAKGSLPAALRPRPKDFTAGGDDWDVDSYPAEGDLGVYTERPLHLTFRDARIDAIFARFGRRLVLRLVDEHGEDLFDRLEYLKRHATELPEYQATWLEIVNGTGCAGDVSGMWQVGVAHFPTLLATARRYEATLVPLLDPDGTADLATVDWSLYPPLHRFTFTTSRWPHLAAHAAAFARLDEIGDGAPDLAALAARLGLPAAGDRQTDDAALTEALAALGLPPRPPAAVPEVVRVWRETAAGHEVVALLLDGPEPLVRSDATGLALRDEGSAAVPAVFLGARSGARLLVLFRDGGGLGPATAAALALEVSDPYTGLDGIATAESAVLAIELPPRPPFFDEEAP